MPDARVGTSTVAIVPAPLSRSCPKPGTGRPSGPSSETEELAGSIASVKLRTRFRGEVVTLELAAGTELRRSACARATPTAASHTAPTRHAAATRGRERMGASVLGEERVIAVALEPAAAHESQRGNHDGVGGAGWHDACQARPDLFRALNPEKREVVVHALNGGLALAAHGDQHIGLVQEGTVVVRFGPVEIRHQRGDRVEARVRVGPAHETVEGAAGALVMSRVELLHVLTAL